MTSTTMLILAYMVIWAGLAGYLAALSRRQRVLSLQTEALAERLGRKEK